MRHAKKQAEKQQLVTWMKSSHQRSCSASSNFQIGYCSLPRKDLSYSECNIHGSITLLLVAPKKSLKVFELQAVCYLTGTRVRLLEDTSRIVHEGSLDWGDIQIVCMTK